MDPYLSENLIIEKTKYNIHWNVVIYATTLYSFNNIYYKVISEGGFFPMYKSYKEML